MQGDLKSLIRDYEADCVLAQQTLFWADDCTDEAWDEAKNNCYQVLQLEPDNVKALYRRSQVYRHQHRFDEAKADIKAALAKMPHDFQLREVSRATRDERCAARREQGASSSPPSRAPPPRDT